MTIRLTTGQIYGQIERRISLNDFCLTESIYGPNCRLPHHAHDRAFICFVLSGTYRELLQGRIHECERSSVVFHPAGEPHSDSFAPIGGRCFNVEISPRWLQRLGTHNAVASNSGCWKDPTLAALMRRIHFEFQCDAPASALLIAALMLELAVSTERTKTGSGLPPVWLRQVEAYIREHPVERASLDDLSAVVKIHPVHIARGFKKHYGCSLGAYWRSIVMQHACDQLVRTRFTLMEIALNCGFSSQGSFSRCFKRMMNLTPSGYRAMGRGLSSDKHVQ